MQIFDHSLVDCARLLGSQRWDRAAGTAFEPLA